MDIRDNLTCLLKTRKQSQLDTGKGQKSVRDYFAPRDNENKPKKFVCKTTQVNLDGCMSVGDLSGDVSTENYWKVVAEKRRIALDEALTENEQLWKLHSTLTEENTQNRKLLEEANSFIEVIKELTQDTETQGE
ncbi:unnamed protein product [Chilo suppressalis]|uniref:Geminin n=1 Tax=Chilo suppressalis TaxID=168631 RepID=A0ABN8B7B2_CHISP|nr:hypothetical protein evm_004322 [Chilo suppressalis]CAH0402171.1 unnamed protein product [Chilo suppressalis]